MKEVAATPEINLATPDGKKLSLKDFAVRSSCSTSGRAGACPAAKKMPAMEKLYQELKDKNFVILAVAVKDRKQDAVDFAKELKITYPIALDPDAKSVRSTVPGDCPLPTSSVPRAKALHAVGAGGMVRQRCEKTDQRSGRR
jgi:peroxiredoxin